MQKICRGNEKRQRGAMSKSGFELEERFCVGRVVLRWRNGLEVKKRFSGGGAVLRSTCGFKVEERFSGGEGAVLMWSYEGVVWRWNSEMGVAFCSWRSGLHVEERFAGGWAVCSLRWSWRSGLQFFKSHLVISGWINICFLHKFDFHFLFGQKIPITLPRLFFPKVLR